MSEEQTGALVGRTINALMAVAEEVPASDIWAGDLYIPAEAVEHVRNGGGLMDPGAPDFFGIDETERWDDVKTLHVRRIGVDGLPVGRCHRDEHVIELEAGQPVTKVHAGLYALQGTTEAEQASLFSYAMRAAWSGEPVEVPTYPVSAEGAAPASEPVEENLAAHDARRK